MLREGGAEVLVLGFRRSAAAPSRIDGAPVVDLGRTFDGRLAQRGWQVARQVLRAPWLGQELRGADVVLARNLEMLALAVAARRLHAPGARLAYECLDIHRLMVSPGWTGALLRGLERTLLHDAAMLIVSSPAHMQAYFDACQGLRGSASLEVLLLENKVFEACPTPCSAPRRPGPPWRIGWFGNLRCRRSFELLTQLAGRRPGQVEVVLSGRPSDREFPSFEAELARAQGVTFTGAYAPGDLARMYREVHFSWAIDFFEAGANSDWLLPNRLYEGGLHAAVPIALRGGECGRWLHARGLGLLVDDPTSELEPFLAALDADAYRALEQWSRQAPREWFSAGRADCGRLVQALSGAA
jgi:hypothetical protein